jgi:hypothetical protein
MCERLLEDALNDPFVRFVRDKMHDLGARRFLPPQRG